MPDQSGLFLKTRKKNGTRITRLGRYHRSIGHATGRRDKVPPVAQAAVAAGADALLIEVHHDPENALCDGAQSLLPDQFERLMERLRLIAKAVDREIVPRAAETVAR